MHEMVALCPRCNLIKGALMKRTFQEEWQQMVTRIADGTLDVRDLYADITPGGGKSTLPLMLTTLIPRLADKLCWVVPRASLARQAEETFQDRTFRRLFGHQASLRWSTNEFNPTRGHQGYVTTYQAIGENPRLHAAEFARQRYILFLDEPHHVQDPGADRGSREARWFHALKPLVEQATLRVYASGTFERGDQRLIGFLPYMKGSDGTFFLDLPETKTVRYLRTDALQEGAIVPLYFEVKNGTAQWIDARGNDIKVESFEEAESREMLHVVLQTDYARALLHSTLTHWRAHKQHWPPAKVLIVAPFIHVAELYARWLGEDFGLTIPVASSKSTKDANEAIARFKATGTGSLDALITVGMAYEGLDVKPITHLACLTRYRSAPWIYQCFARACRATPGKTAGYVFAPDDPDMQRIVEVIKAEQFGFAREEDTIEGPHKRREEPPGQIIPLQSQATTTKAYDFQTAMTEQETQLIQDMMRRHGIHGFSPIQLKQFSLDLATMTPPDEEAAFQDPEAPDLTPTQREERYRRALYKRCNAIDHHCHGDQWGTVNRELVQHIGKKRELCTLEELSLCWQYLLKRYPDITHIHDGEHSDEEA
jgi:superfamily II DNA or RNA helicase